MNTILVPNTVSLIDEVVSHLKSSKRDFSSNIVVFPGKRPSHFVRKAISDRGKRSFIPPLIFSMDEFIDFIYVEKLKLFYRKIEKIDALAILYNLHRYNANNSRSDNTIVNDSFITPDAFISLGLRIYSDIEELYIEKISPHMVRGIEPMSEEKIPERTLSRLQSLTYFFGQFYQNIKDMKLSTRSSRYRTVSNTIDNIDLSHYTKIIFSGLYALTSTERELFKKLMKLKNILFVYQDGPGIRERLIELGINYETLITKSEESTTTKIQKQKSKISLYKSPDTHGQVFGLRELLNERLEKDRLIDKNILIMLPSSEILFPLFHHGLCLFDEDRFNISIGYPIHRTPVYSFFNNLMELISSIDNDRFYVPDYLKFVLHPYTKNIYFGSSPEITRIMFHSIDEELSRNRTRTFMKLSEIENNEILFKGIIKRINRFSIENPPSVIQIKKHLKNIHNSAIKGFLSFKNINDIARKGIDILTYIYENSTSSFHPFFHPFAETFIMSLDILSKSLLKDIVFDQSTGYFNFLRKYLMTCRTPFDGTPLRGIQVLGFLETRGLKFNTVFVLDTNEDILPNSRMDDTLLPFKAREILGLPTYIDRDRLTEYYFENLLNGAEEVHLFFIENERKEKSRFIEKLIWDRQKKNSTTDKNYVTSIEYTLNLKSKGPSPVFASHEMINLLKNYSYSATSLDAYLKCPLMFYYRYVLNLQEKWEIAENIEKIDIGMFIHKVLFQYFKNRCGYKLTRGDINIKEMEFIIERLFDEVFGSDQTGAIHLLKEQTKRHLEDFLIKYQIPLIKEQEVSILNLENYIRITRQHFNIEGRIDRIEKRDNSFTIIDYKISSNPNHLKINFERIDINNRESWSEGIGSLQLPFYSLLYSEKTKKEMEDLNSIFLLLGRSTIDKSIELPLINSTERYRENYEMLKYIIYSLLNEIVDISKPFNPTSKMQENCNNCTFSYICGV